MPDEDREDLINFCRDVDRLEGEDGESVVDDWTLVNEQLSTNE
jgi:hypothetical protein